MALARSAGMALRDTGRRLRPYVNTAIELGSPATYLNALFDRYTGGEARPAFFDIDATYPALNELTRHHAVIREELEGILPLKSTMPRYHELDATQRYISDRVDRDRDWKVFMLYVMGERPAANRALCPRTCALLDGIPDLFQAFFSILDPGKSIPGHRGSYRGYLRYHLGLKVPRANPPSLRVKDQWHVWREGAAVLFDDSHHHQVVNTSAEMRVVLIVDVLRPMPPLPAAVNRVVTKGFIRWVYAKGVLGASAAISRRRSREVDRVIAPHGP